MTSIVISPALADKEATTERIELHVLLKLSDFKGVYDQLEVWRSTDHEAGPYEELTAEAWSFPRLPKGAANAPSSPVTGAPVITVGKTLELLLDEEDELVVTFTGSDPLTFSDAAGQIEAQSAGRVRGYVLGTGELVLERVLAGASAALRVVGGSAAALLGLPTIEPGSLAFGKEARIALSPSVVKYSFIDLFGSKDYFYKTRFRNRSSGATSEFSSAFGSTHRLGLSADNIVLGTAYVIDQQGRPQRNVLVSVYHAGAQLVDGKLIAETRQDRFTNEEGYVDFSLIRGMNLSVSVANTNIARSIKVPTDPLLSTFSLFDPAVATEPDAFKVMVPDIITAEKRTL